MLIETITAISTSLAPWFPAHLQRNIYLSLLHLEAEPGQEKAPTVPESVLKAALLRRAAEDIHRIMQIRNAKQALTVLQQRGSIGDDLWQSFVRAEGEMEDELRDVVMEVCPFFGTPQQLSLCLPVSSAHSRLLLQANAYTPNWGQTIFQSANEIATNALLRKRIENIQSQAPSEKEWWEKRREAIRVGFMSELDREGTGRETPDVTVASKPQQQQKSLFPPSQPSTAERATSDDDTVLVEGGGPATTSATDAGRGSTKKKKNNKK